MTIKGINRLVRVEMGDNATYKGASTDALVGQLLYAFSDSDEVMPAKVLNDFAKTHPELSLFVAGFSGEGVTQSAADVTALACQARTSLSPKWWRNCFHQFTMSPMHSLATSMRCSTVSKPKLSVSCKHHSPPKAGTRPVPQAGWTIHQSITIP